MFTCHLVSGTIWLVYITLYLVLYLFTHRPYLQLFYLFIYCRWLRHSEKKFQNFPLWEKPLRIFVFDNDLTINQVSVVQGAKVRDCNNLVNEFELHLRYYIQFRINTLGERHELLISPCGRLNSTTTDWLWH